MARYCETLGCYLYIYTDKKTGKATVKHLKSKEEIAAFRAELEDMNAGQMRMPFAD